jgi:predicted AAA+ superfamily ATPase
MEKEYIERLFDKELEFYLKTVGAVQIVGPKWCGKSRTAKRHAKTVIDLMKKKERDQYVELAKNAPEVLLNSGEKPILIDEWQVISFIWNSIKEAIDENGGFGQYILTGSVTDNTAMYSLSGEENEKHTGTGRIIKKVMRPMSLFESGDSNGNVSIANLKKGTFKPSICNKNIFDYAY